MFVLKRLVCCTLFVFILASAALAQENRAPFDKPQVPVPAAPLVTATASAKRLRFVSPGTVVQLRLEVYNETGQKLFDTELHGGNVLDWHLQNGAGERLSAGSYACVLTIKSLSGRISQRVGLVTVDDTKAAVVAGGAQLSLAQQQTIGPVEDNAAFTVLPESEAAAMTAVTHDGSDGQLSRTRGALSFRRGDFFSGKDKEQMRLTEDGRLGIGTSEPQAQLDVAGTIRAGEGFMFSDGSTLKLNKKGVLTRTSADGATFAAPSAVSSTQNRIAKFTDNAGTLGDSGITETAGGLVGIGTTTPGALLDVSDNTNHLKYSPTTGKLTLTGPAASLTVNPGLRIEFNSDPDAGLSYLAYSHDNISQAYDAYWNGTAWVSSHAGANFALYKNASQLAIGFNAGTPKGSTFPAFNTTAGVIFSKTGTMGIGGAPGNAALYVDGNVGIGTTTPNTKLDVVGKINTSTEFSIGGNRVLTVNGIANTIAGIGAGASSTGHSNSFFGNNAGGGLTNSGNANSFFGERAGASNTTANGNSFFGSAAGASNTTGIANSFFGLSAGASNTSGGDNSFYGSQAGISNTTGTDNSFFGRLAGAANNGNNNSFFGAAAGDSNTTGTRNSFFGQASGGANQTGSDNTFIGRDSGGATTIGSGNTFLGSDSGDANTDGINNTFIGRNAGNTNTTGSANTVIGYGANLGSSGLIFATAVGANAQVTQSNSLVLGNSVNVGIGTTSPDFKLHVVGGSDAEPASGGYIVAGQATSTNVVIDNNEIMARNNGATATLALNADGGDVNLIQGGTGRVGIGTSTPGAKLDVNGIARADSLEINGGAIRVIGAGVGTNTAAYIHVVPAADEGETITVLDHPLLNGNPNAIIFAIAKFTESGGTAYHCSARRVAYGNGRWGISSRDDTTFCNLYAGDQFHVLIIIP